MINIEDKILLSESSEEGPSLVGELSLEQAFFLKTAGPANGETEQFSEFLVKAKAAGKIEISISWCGTPVQGMLLSQNPVQWQKKPTVKGA